MGLAFQTGFVFDRRFDHSPMVVDTTPTSIHIRLARWPGMIITAGMILFVVVGVGFPTLIIRYGNPSPSDKQVTLLIVFGAIFAGFAIVFYAAMWLAYCIKSRSNHPVMVERDGNVHIRHGDIKCHLDCIHALKIISITWQPDSHHIGTEGKVSVCILAFETNAPDGTQKWIHAVRWYARSTGMMRSLAQRLASAASLPQPVDVRLGFVQCLDDVQPQIARN